MRIGVIVLATREQRAARCEIRDDLRVGLEDRQTGVGTGLAREVAGRIDRAKDRETEAHPRFEVVGTVTGRRMHRARARVELDVFRGNHLRIAIEERMTDARAHQRGSGRPAQTLERAAVGTTEDVGGERIGDEQEFAVAAIDAVVGFGF